MEIFWEQECNILPTNILEHFQLYKLSRIIYTPSMFLQQIAEKNIPFKAVITNSAHMKERYNYSPQKHV